MTAKGLLNFIYINNLIDSFRSTAVSLKICRSLPVTDVSAERSFF